MKEPTFIPTPSASPSPASHVPSAAPGQAEAPARASALVSELTALLGDATAASVARIILALVDGSSLEDACVLADFPLPEFERLQKAHDLVGRQVERSRLKYKEKLMKAVRGQDDKMDVKTAMWLLERAFPDEFGPNARKPDESAGKKRDVIREAFDFIRSHPIPLVNPTAGQPAPAPGTSTPSGPTAEEAAAARASLERIMNNASPA